MDALEAMRTCCAMRYLKPDPVPEELIRTVVHAATCASSPGNSQGWDFIVVRDADQRRRIATAIAAAVKPVMPAVPPDGSAPAMLVGAHYLLDRLPDVPLWIFVCGRAVYPANAPDEAWIATALYPAAQNLIVAARACGLGSVFTMYHRLPEAEIRAILDLPDDVHIGVTVPLGWPAREFHSVKRRPLDAVLHEERW